MIKLASHGTLFLGGRSRKALIDRVRTAIAEGRYVIDADAVAAKLLRGASRN